MKRSKNYLKPILALEGAWTADLVNRLSVSPILEMLGKFDGTACVHLPSNTLEEFSFNLDIYKGVKEKGILLLSFHGRPGRLSLMSSEIEIEQIGRLMGRKFKNWILYLDSCSVLRIERDRIDTFIQDTGVSFVIGYTKDSPWIEGTAIQLIVLNQLQKYRNMGTFWRRFQKQYSSLIKITGLTVHSNGH